jgi:hypothetical protein
MKFKEYLQLVEKHQLTHLEHIEDLVFLEGVKGAEKTLKYLEYMIDDIKHHKGGLKVQVKVDGAPSIIAGWSPEDGRFFVGTKSFFNKTPKINYTPEDVDRNHGHAAGLANKLKLGLKYLPKVIKKGNIIQGDFMYDKNDLKEQTIDGVKVLTFTPNTITYAVEKGTPLYKRIKDSQIGVIWHTSYDGNTLESLNGSFRISNNQLNQTKDVYSRTTNAELDNIGWSDNEYKILKRDLQELNNTLRKFDSKQINEISNNKKLSLMIRTYINDKVKKDNHKFNKNEIGGLIDFIKSRYQKDIENLKTQKGKERKIKELEDFINHLRQYASTLYNLFIKEPYCKQYDLL